MKSNKLLLSCRARVRYCVAALSAAGLVVLCALLVGCSLSPLAKHATAFSLATNTVVSSSEDAYRAANRLRQDEQIAESIYAYEKNPNTWNPYTDWKPLLSPSQLDARIKVLDGLRAYAASLVQLTGKPSKTDSDALDSAASGVGSNLQSLSQTVSTDLSTAIPGASAISTTNANIISTAVLGLGEYLQGRKVRGSLPKVTQDMNQNVQTLCELLKQDIDVLRRQADVDYGSLIESESQFLLHQGDALTPVEKRNETGKLIALASEQKANDALLEKLQDAIVKLALTHQALAAAAQGNNPETLQQKISDLEAAGEELGNFYKSLPTT